MKGNFEIEPMKNKFIILRTPNAASSWDGLRHLTRQELYQVLLNNGHSKSYLDVCCYTVLCNLFAIVINRPDLKEFVE